MISTPQESATHIIQTIKELLPIEHHFLDEDILEGIVEDLLYEKLEEVLSQKDIAEIERHTEDEDYFREYCQIHISKYYTILEEITNDIITDYIVEEKEPDLSFVK